MSDGLRVGILGGNVDNPVNDSNPNWTLAPPPLANRLNTPQRIITTAINAMSTQVGNALENTAEFETRFNNVIGEEYSGGADEATLDSIGIKLIPAIAGWTDDFTNSNAWTCAHNLHSQFVSVRAVKSDGTIMVPEIDYTDADNCVLHFAGNVSGSAIIRR
jgi:hypothetical protein